MNIKIGINKDIDTAKKIVNNYFPDKKIKIEECYNNRYLFNINSIKNKSLIKNDIHNAVADMILDMILNIYSRDFISKRINIKKNNLKAKERNEIVQISKEILLNKDNFIIEKEYLSNKIKDYIIETPFIWVDGFIQFRLKELDLFINLAIDKGIEEFTAEKEYKEFIKILQYFVDVQEPKYDFINLVFNDKEYKLLDERDNLIDNDFFSDIVAEIDDEGISKEDLLISSLIVIAPKKIIIHLEENDINRDVIRVITNVFQDRVYFCFDCKKHSSQIKVKKGK
ncbi:MAG: hypothetical protein GX987_01715 [Tissierellia bacterium]|nr:hypothetical protein [Tissierellia bacterium]